MSSKKLVIVESPTKARKLSEYLDSSYVVRASVGHVRDLPKSKIGIDTQTWEPTYQVSPDKTKVIKELRDHAAKAESIYLATDPDREGEAIAWHIKYLLQHKDAEADSSAELDSGSSKKTSKKSTKKTAKTSTPASATAPFYRATFHEITKSAVLEALAHPSHINQDLVDAQQARRVVDRLVGYQLSPVLWRKIRRGLSAGRVQSVALRLIVEREREIEAFKPDEYWELDVALQTGAGKLKSAMFVDGKPLPELPSGVLVARVAELDGGKYEPSTESQVTPVVNALPGAEYQVSLIEKKERRRQSPPPFTTSTLQQAAANRLGYTSKQTMRLAQQLYEEGLITYHRTDSVNLSQSALAMAREFIEQELGAQYLPAKPRYFKSSSKNAQEAHEAVRVTQIHLRGDAVAAKGHKLTGSHVKLYDLIWRRFVSSQMTEAVYDQTSISIVATPESHHRQHFKQATLKASGSTLKFDGWLRFNTSSQDVILPELAQGQTLEYVEHQAAQKFTQPPARYNDASLVKELEKRGIGRPSTYASIISVIEDRGYVDRIDRRFQATAIGSTVSDFLLQHFPQIMDYDFTAEMEDDLDAISLGKKDWQQVMKQFYGPFEKVLTQVQEKAERVQVPVEKTGEACPKCGAEHQGEVVIRTGRYGKFKSCSRYPECDFTENLVETLPGVLCPLCQQGEVVAKNSRWGKQFYGCRRYPECDWASWKAPKPGETITAQEWAEQQAARQARKEQRQAKYSAAGKKASRVTKKRSTAKRSSTKRSISKRSAATKTSASTKTTTSKTKS